MTGFLRKDIYSLCSMYRKNLILVFLLYTVMTLAMNVTFLLYMMIWLMGEALRTMPPSDSRASSAPPSSLQTAAAVPAPRCASRSTSPPASTPIPERCRERPLTPP